ncbi:MAG: hypothetical protein WA996_23790 [Candidatus Promineifilaceae bacterium]
MTPEYPNRKNNNVVHQTFIRNRKTGKLVNQGDGSGVGNVFLIILMIVVSAAALLYSFPGVGAGGKIITIGLLVSMWWG